MHKIKNNGTKKCITGLAVFFLRTGVFRRFAVVRGLVGLFKFRVLVAIIISANEVWAGKNYQCLSALRVAF